MSTASGNAGRSLSALHLFILFGSGLLISCPQRGYSIDLSVGLDISRIETSGATAEISGEKLLIRTEPVSRPRIVVNGPGGRWDLQTSTKISMLVRNTGDSTIRLSCILGDHGWNEGMLILHPREQETMEVLIRGMVLEDKHPLKVNFENMNGTPGGYLHHWVKFHADSMRKLTFSLLNNNSNSSFEINNYGPFAYDGNDLVGHPSVPEPFRSIGAVDGSFAPLSDVPTFPHSVGPDKPGWIYSWDKEKHLNYVDENNRDLTPDEMHAEWAVRKIEELEIRPVS